MNPATDAKRNFDRSYSRAQLLCGQDRVRLNPTLPTVREISVQGLFLLILPLQPTFLLMVKWLADRFDDETWRYWIKLEFNDVIFIFIVL